MRLLKMILLAVSLLLAIGQPTTFAQATVSTSAAPAISKTGKLEFDVASVRVSDEQFIIKGMDFLNPAGNQAPPPGGLFSWNVPLPALINFAYDLRSSQERREMYKALPKWAAQDNWYTIEARAEGNPTREQVRQMVRSLLQDRFQFAAHIEKRDGQIYLLEASKPQPGLKLHPEGAPCTLPASLTDGNKFPHAYPSYKQISPRCGFFNRELSRVGERRLEMLDMPMQQIADSLGLVLPLAVVDKTGLSGHYDAVLDYGPDIPPSADAPDELGLLPLPAALEKQLGLKLVKQNAQVDTFILDHLGELSEN